MISTVVLLTALPASGATGSDRAIPRCPAARAHVLLADAQATIYTIRERRFERTEGRREVLPIIATRGCNVSNGHSFRLDWEFAQAGAAESGSPIPPNLTLNGGIVAYEEFVLGSDRYKLGEGTTEWRVVVRDLRTGRVLYDVPTDIASPPNPHFIDDGATTAIVVKSDGAVAWVTDTAQGADHYQVSAVDVLGSRMLASGSSIDPHSLALAGSTVYWTQGGKPESASLN